MNKLTKLILIIILVVVLGGIGVYYFASNKTSIAGDNVDNTPVVTDYDDLLSQVMERKESDIESINITSQESKPSIETVLQVGIRTSAGIVQSYTNNSQTLPLYGVKVDNINTAITSVVPIKLVKAYLLGGDQVLLFAVGSGDNNCDVQYRILSIHETKYRTTQAFGSCLPFTSVIESDDALQVSTPQNNPYLGDGILYTYLYKNGIVKLLSKPSKNQIKKTFSSYTAAKIINLAKTDGCYQDGVMLDSVSCNGGKRYCSMFKSLGSNAKRDSNYMILKDFCS
jgi:hypothetical protein